MRHGPQHEAFGSQFQLGHGTPSHDKRPLNYLAAWHGIRFSPTLESSVRLRAGLLDSFPN
jgi:hypothetical protein